MQYERLERVTPLFIYSANTHWEHVVQQALGYPLNMEWNETDFRALVEITEVHLRRDGERGRAGSECIYLT